MASDLQATPADVVGLSCADAAARLEREGPNTLRDPLILVLLVAIMLTVITGDWPDAAIVEAAALPVDEVALTGESTPVGKTARHAGDEAEQSGDLVSAGMVAARGRGRAVVTATGVDSAMGRIAAAAKLPSSSSVPAGGPPHGRSCSATSPWRPCTTPTDRCW